VITRLPNRILDDFAGKPTCKSAEEGFEQEFNNAAWADGK
jgi:hypothetical protein